MSSTKIRLKRVEDSTLVRLLITHPMETGRRIDSASGEMIPAHFISKLTVFHEDKVIASCNLGPGISRDPYFSFRFKNGKAGDLVTVTWTDNLGESDKIVARIQ